MEGEIIFSSKRTAQSTSREIERPEFGQWNFDFQWANIVLLFWDRSLNDPKSPQNQKKKTPVLDITEAFVKLAFRIMSNQFQY